MVSDPMTTLADGRVSASTSPKVRRVRFRFGEPEPMTHYFVEGNIVLSHLVAILSAVFPPGEESFIRSVRRFSDRVSDPALKRRVATFIGQESVHGQEHRRFNDNLIKSGYPFVSLFTFEHDSLRQRAVERIEKMSPGYVHLAMTAAAEHYTATLAERVLSSDDIQAIPADLEGRHLLNWHAMEELEHKAVAFDVYRTVGGPEWIRIGVMAVMYIFTIPGAALGVMLSILTDPRGWRPIKLIRQAHYVFRGPILKGLMADLRKYMRPGFHPDDIDTEELLEQWRRELFGTNGALVDHLK